MKMKHFDLKTLLLAIFINLVGVKALAYDAQIDGIYYNFSGSEAIVTYMTYYGNNNSAYSGNVVIPATVNYNGISYNVTSIGELAFRNCSDLVGITIPNSITSIGRGAFWGTAWYNNQPDGLIYAGKVAYTYKGTMPSNTKIVLLEETLGIADNAFENCSGMTSVTFPNSVENIGNFAFYNCSRLTSINIPNSVTKIGGYAFSGCSSANTIVVGNGVKSLPDCVFGTGNNLYSVTIGSGVSSISKYAFCIKDDPIVSRYVPVKTIWLTDTLPNGYSYAAGNMNYTKIEFPFLSSMFEVDGVKYVPVSSSDKTCDAIDCLYNDDAKNINVSETVSYGGTVYTVRNIADYTFYHCSGLTNVVIPNSMTNIGTHTFYGCSSLQSVIIGNGITSIPDYVFGTNNNLKSLTIGSSVLSIGDRAFVYDYGWGSNNHAPVKTIWLTNTPPTGYKNAAGLEVNYVANELYTSLNKKTVYSFLSSLFEVDGVKYVPVSPSDRTCDAIDCLYDEDAESIHIGKTVTNKGIALTVEQVHPYAFYGNMYVKDVDLSFDGNVGNYAFYGCKNVNNAVIKNTGYLGDNAFSSITDRLVRMYLVVVRD